ncbi:hypothetical protein Pcinc_014384 [Petrolisthes cinctipes]|uniref:NACHT domain-containing protein n=1 Tax=Petrolisthes cinctipes TaxID=88211 RepID=A0AAE1FV01_PETCI|nr:hypothetical protein Pcinc_014384 [Petrolisthes cinctipes]
MLYEVGQPIMYKIFTLGTRGKASSKDLQTYLDKLDPVSTANYIKVKDGKKMFNPSQLERIKSKPSGMEWDITLLFLTIKWACENVASFSDPAWFTKGAELENCVYLIKTYRNEASHEQLQLTEAEFLDKTKELRDLFINTLKAAQLRYTDHFSVTELHMEIISVNCNVDTIQNEVFGQGDFIARCGSWLLVDIEEECRSELTEKYKHMSNINPVSFTTGNNLSMDVSLIFTNIEIECPEDQSKNIVSHDDFLVEVEKNLSRGRSGARVVQLEGLAGSGKTTLVNLMLKQWCDGMVTIKNLDSYKLVLHMTCKDASTDTYKKFLERSFPCTFTKYRSLLEPLLSKCRILVLIDSFDESNPSSRQLVQDILHQLRSADATIVTTSRPERSDDFQDLVTTSLLTLTNTKIKGIPEGKRVEFILRNHPVVARHSGSGRDTNTVVEELKKLVKNDHFRLALNLILGIWVCDQKPRVLNALTTQTELYYQTVHLSWMKLNQRLSTNPQTRDMERWLRVKRVEEWKLLMYKEQFNALINNQVTLSSEAVDRLRDASFKRQLPADELLGSCLSLKSFTQGVQEYLAPHKGLQDFYSALHLMKRIKEQKPSINVRAALGFDIAKDRTRLRGLQNALQHLAGVLHLDEDMYSDSVLLELINLLEGSGMKEAKQWLDIIADTSPSPTVVATIAKYCRTGTVFYNPIVIEDSRVHACAQLLSNMQRSWVSVNVTDNNVVTSVLPILVRHNVVIREYHTKMLCELAPSNVAVIIKGDPTTFYLEAQEMFRHTCTVLRLWHDYQCPQTISSDTDAILGTILSRNPGVSDLACQLSASVRERLQNSPFMTLLFVSIASDDQAASLMNLIPKLSHLRILRVHVTAGVTPDAITTTLPDIRNDNGDGEVGLLLSDITEGEEDRACEMATKLLPSSLGYSYIRFPRSSLDEAGWWRVLNGLGQNGVRVGYGGVEVPFTSVNEEQQRRLDALSRNTVWAGFGRRAFTEEGW